MFSSSALPRTVHVQYVLQRWLFLFLLIHTDFVQFPVSLFVSVLSLLSSPFSDLFHRQLAVRSSIMIAYDPFNETAACIIGPPGSCQNRVIQFLILCPSEKVRNVVEGEINTPERNTKPKRCL